MFEIGVSDMNRKNKFRGFAKRAASLLLVCLVAVTLTGCGTGLAAKVNTTDNPSASSDAGGAAQAGKTSEAEAQAGEISGAAAQAGETSGAAAQDVTPDKIPAYSSAPSVEINGGVPFFAAEDRTENSFESYSDLDSLGRCGPAYGCLGQETMPTEKRGDIGMVRPSGWHTVKYDGIDGNYLYNRCHLIAYMLSGENANEKNLITGTRYMNTEGMLPYEERTADYIRSTGHHVLYRVTPVFEGNNLVASGVLMEAQSVEDDGLVFCVYCYNVQPGVTINYSTGDSSGPEFTGSGGENGGNEAASEENGGGNDSAGAEQNAAVQDAGTQPQSSTYVLNTNTKKFHRPDCSSADRIKPANRQDYTGSREDLIAQGYEPCKNCNP
ncbi:MAG: DNA/RNA non-specific endonuclease [Lachnospiraceae bacterium]|jgi:DNA-entry nuclease|nr:DNA/RNA non-specific endonuclease [Lachnospiraceae bacterium]